MVVQVAGEELVKVSFGVFAFLDAVGAIGIGHHGEMLVVLDQCIDEGFAVLVMAVIVAGAVHDQEIAFELMGKGDRRTVAKAFFVVLG